MSSVKMNTIVFCLKMMSQTTLLKSFIAYHLSRTMYHIDRV
ncbi:MAG: hypothetical protein OFPI_04810 [Osedax symbiont Rs2]|nr:MAG: hypothetical protein OFPI_04810 [Osedax symbiont Rs2]